MIIEHIAIWTGRPGVLRDYYTRYFGGISGPEYRNPEKQFRSYFIRFGPGIRLEIMSAPGIPENLNDTVNVQHQGIIHFAFEAVSVEEVNEMSRTLHGDGYPILDGPRKTGDGYYEFVTLDPDRNRIEVTTAVLQEETGRKLALELLDGEYAVCRLDPGDPFPGWAMEGELLSLTRSADELSVVCRSDRVPEGVVSERGWRVLQVAGPLGFEMTGILSSLTSPLAEQGISVFAVSTYKTDYLMVKSRQIVAATVILGRKFEIL